MTNPSHSIPTWRKSTRSGGQGECVEIADNECGLIPVRDSKRPDADILRFGRTAWQTFLRGLR